MDKDFFAGRVFVLDKSVLFGDVKVFDVTGVYFVGCFGRFRGESSGCRECDDGASAEVVLNDIAAAC